MKTTTLFTLPLLAVSSLGAQALQPGQTQSPNATVGASTPAPRSFGPTSGTEILPASLSAAFGNSNNNIPFSWSPCSYMQVHSLSSFSSSAVALFQSMTLRMGQGFANQTSRNVDLELFLAESPNDATTSAGTFASNVVAGTEINVIPRQTVSLPQVPDNS